MALPFWPKIVTSGLKENFELSLPLSLFATVDHVVHPCLQCRRGFGFEHGDGGEYCAPSFG